MAAAPNTPLDDEAGADPGHDPTGPELCRDNLAGEFNLHASHNAWQAVAVLVSLMAGAVAGWRLGPEMPPPAMPPPAGAVAGAFLGLVAGTLLSGFALAFFRSPPRYLPWPHYLAKYRRLRRRLRICCYVLPVQLLLWPLGIWLFVRGDNLWLELTSLIILVSACFTRAYLASLGERIKHWPCPRCGRTFGFRGIREPFPVQCNHCGLTVPESSRSS